MRFFYWSLSLALIASTGYAEPTVRERLQNTMQELNVSKEREKQLGTKTQQMVSEYKTLQEQLVDLAKEVQRNEKAASVAEEKLGIITKEYDEKYAHLNQRQAQLKTALAAAIRLSQTPPEAALLMPGETQDVLITSRAIKNTSDAIKADMESVANQLKELGKIKEKVERNRALVASKQSQLAEQRKILASKTKEKKKLAEKLQVEHDEESKKLKELVKQADNLQSLIAGLEKNRKPTKRGDVAPHESGIKGSKGKLRSFSAARGEIRLPAAGKLLEGYGDRDEDGKIMRGYVIQTRNNAQITAPYDGEVMFTGPFLNYGNMVILRHSDDYHTLLSGLNKTDVKVGEFLLEGEPVGGMGSGDADRRLYLELRKNNQPIDPSSWFANLNKRGG